MSLLRQWRYLLLTLLAVSALVAVAACGDDDDGGEDTATPTDAPSETDAPVAGGEITVHTTEPESLDPHFSDFSVDITIMQMMNRGLYDILPGGVLRPAYASELPTVSDDGLTYTIPIKAGMTWADGETLDANDFVYGIQRTCDPNNAGHYQYVLTNIGGCDDYYGGEGALADVTVSAPDDLTLEIVIAAPQATFKSILALWMVYPAPDESLASVDAEWPAPPNTPCSGPFCVTEWVAGDHLTFVKNESYGLTPVAKLDKITLRIIDDFSTALQAYNAGEVDMIRLGTVDLPLVRDRDDYVPQALPITIGLEYYMEDEVVSDLNVRLALSRAIDRDLMNEVVFSNAHIPTTNWVPAEEPGANALDAFEAVIGFDEEGAKQALADAGFPGGEGFPGLTILMRDDETEKTFGAFLQEQFLTILGIDLTVEILDSQTRQERFNSGDFQILIGGWGHDYPDAENWLVGLFETGASINKQKCSDPDIDAAIAAAIIETEDAPRWALLQEAEKIAVETLCGYAPLYHRGNHYMISPDLGGVSPTLEDHFMPQFPEDWFLNS
jgi:ABC-type oligopeptide transport system substrate-binding subunit